MNKKEICSSWGETPITSFGIILFTVKDDKLLYLICQRRDSIEYTDFIRGRYSRHNLKTYISLMTPEERQRIVDYNFEELWHDLWINHNSKLYKEIYPKAKARFNQNFLRVKDLLKETESLVSEPIWGFPKGKQHSRETEIQCAVREFKEESRLYIDHKNILNMPPAIELFKGSNGKMYSTFYYIAFTAMRLPIRRIVLDGIRKDSVSDEIRELKWVTLQESKTYLPVWRQKLLEETEKRIKKHLN